MCQDDRDLNLSAPAQHLQRNIVSVSPHLEINGRCAQLQVAQDHLVEEFREMRIYQPDLAFDGVELQSQCGLEQGKRRRAGPSLRRAGYRIKRRAAVLLAPEATD